MRDWELGIGHFKFQISNLKLPIVSSRFSVFGLQPSVLVFVCAFCLAFLTHSVAAGADERKVVIPFDFVSKFDDGRYGQIVGDMIWKKLSRDGGFVVPESMQDVRDYCESHKLRPSPEMDLDKMKKIVEENFGGHVGIWGSVERASGTEGEIYDLAIKCVDFSAKPQPKVIYEKKARTNSASEIPHVYVKEMLDALAGRQAIGPARLDQVAEENWKKNPNLVSGDFEQGTDGVPKGWDKVAGQQREPLGKLVRWTTEKGGKGDSPLLPERPNGGFAQKGTVPFSAGKNKVIRFTLDRNVAENEGVMYYSDFFPVEEGAKYRFQCRWRTDGPTVKMFLKCYDEDETGRRREVYRSQQNFKGPNGTWNTHTEDFTPRHTKYSPKWGRVMLYAYLSPGEVEFDDVVVKQVVPPSPGERAKVRRHSRESKITVKEVEEDERRSRDLKERQ
jgi:hypothetical protein